MPFLFIQKNKLTHIKLQTLFLRLKIVKQQQNKLKNIF